MTLITPSQSIPRFILEQSHFANLEDVSFDYNYLSSLPPEFARLSRLRRFTAAQNKFTEFPLVLIRLPLEVIDLELNEISAIPPGISEMSRLTRLNMKSNYLETLPVEIANIATLKSLEVEKNPLSLLPTHLMNSPNFQDLMAYLRALGANQVPWMKVKVMVVGKEAVGKTSLIRSILSATPKRIRIDQCDVPLSTEGIDIEEWKPKPPAKGQKVVKALPSFQLWDLGGQSVFYPTHQFFMSRCAIYLIVFDVTAPDWERVTYWVKQIRASTCKEMPALRLPTKIVGCFWKAF